MNVNYIRAAIEANTGIRLTLKETVRYLYEERLVTLAQANRMLFPGYTKLFPAEIGKGYVSESSIIPVDMIIRD